MTSGPQSPRISFALGFHNHQPVGNFGWVFEDVYQKAYRPMVDLLLRHPTVRCGLHYTGPLLQWLDLEHPDFLDDCAGSSIGGRSRSSAAACTSRCWRRSRRPTGRPAARG